MEQQSIVKTDDMVRVYLVEDSPIVRDFVIEAVSENPAVQVIGHAETEMDAIAGIMKGKPDVVILDIHLRKGNGLSVLRSLKQMILPAFPLVIVLTNYGVGHYQNRCMELGADYFLDKSTQFERVTELLAELARKRS